MKKGLLQDSPARDAWDVPTDFPTLPAITCAAFCLLWAFLQNYQELCLLGVIWCDLKKKSVDHNLTGQKRTARGGLPVYLYKVCASVCI